MKKLSTRSLYVCSRNTSRYDSKENLLAHTILAGCWRLVPLRMLLNLGLLHCKVNACGRCPLICPILLTYSVTKVEASNVKLATCEQSSSHLYGLERLREACPNHEDDACWA